MRPRAFISAITIPSRVLVLGLAVSLVLSQMALGAYSGQGFQYGRFELTEWRKMGGSKIKEAAIKDHFAYLVMEKPRFIAGKDGWFGHSCLNPVYQFGRPDNGKGSALSYGIPAVASLQIKCGQDYIAFFDVLDDDKIGYYYEGYYLILKLKNPGKS